MKEQNHMAPKCAIRMKQSDQRADQSMLNSSMLAPEPQEERHWRKFKLEWRPMLKTIGVLALATGVATLFDSSFIENNNVSIIYTLAVVIISSMTPGYIYGIIASVLSVIGVNYFFASPQFAFNFTQTGYPITFASLLIVSIIMSTLMTRYREAAHVARLREMRTKTLRIDEIK